MPAFFVDLNLDQIIDAITVGKDEYDLKPFFYRSLNDVDTIHYRHEVMQDLENAVLFKSVTSFANEMRSIRDRQAQADKRQIQSPDRDRTRVGAIGYLSVAVPKRMMLNSLGSAAGIDGLSEFRAAMASSALSTSNSSRLIFSDPGDSMAKANKNRVCITETVA